jgi:hypothetical protein
MEHGLEIGIIALVIAVTVVGVWGRHKWKQFRSELFQEEGVSRGDKREPMTNSGSSNPLLSKVVSVLCETPIVLDRDPSPSARPFKEFLNRQNGFVNATAAAMESTLREALDSAELKSRLVELGGMYIYIVVVPNRHQHPRLIRRYDAFANGWRNHVELVEAALGKKKRLAGVVIYSFFLNPDGSESELLLSYADAQNLILPRGLLTTCEMNSNNIGLLDTSIEFKLF